MGFGTYYGGVQGCSTLEGGQMSDQHRKVKQSGYLPEDMLSQLRAEAERLERPLSWVLNRAWRIASPSIAAIPDA